MEMMKNSIKTFQAVSQPNFVTESGLTVSTPRKNNKNFKKKPDNNLSSGLFALRQTQGITPDLAWALHLAARWRAGNIGWELFDWRQSHAGVFRAVGILLVGFLPNGHPQGLLQLMVGFTNFHVTVVALELQARQGCRDLDWVG
jgi:hypothetical protein